MRQYASMRGGAAHPCASILAPLLFVAGTTGCLNYPDADERFAEEIVYSRYDKSADFGEFKTFAISEKVVVFDEEDDEIDQDDLDKDKAKQLVDRVVKNMTDRGYRRVNPKNNPDLGLTVSVVSGTVTAAYADYWGYYWGYPYYYYYYPYYYTYSYNTGTVIVDTVDLKNTPPPDEDAGAPPGDAGWLRPQLKVIWTGLVYGVLAESSGANLQDALDGIDQAFKQSPYFRSE